MPLERNSDVKDETHIKMHKMHIDTSIRSPVLASLGCSWKGVSQPHVDLSDPVTAVAGVEKRFACKGPVPAKFRLRKLKRFVQRWLRQNLTPLGADADTSFETWISNAPYPEWRKDELREVYDKLWDINDPEKRYTWCKSFIKQEVYPEFKHARGINSRTDQFKVTVGPIFKLIENEVYKHKAFIKHVPVAQRPDYIMEHVFQSGCRYLATDYSSFEALFTDQIMKAVEMQLYYYMVQNLPEGMEWFEFISSVLTGVNVCVFKYFMAWIRATRMSGEMNTSLGNGFSNLMFALFILFLKGVPPADVRVVVEGDDGLICLPKDLNITSEDFAEIGMKIKIVLHDRIETASFCGIIFDENDRQNVTDPLQQLATFGWVTSQYASASRKTKMALLRCKALSLAYQYPGCPILSALARYGLRVTKSYDVRRILENDRTMSQWNRERLEEAFINRHKIINTPVGRGTRLLVEEMYGIRVETQLLVEEYLDSLTHLQTLDIPILDLMVPKDWINYDFSYRRMVAPSELHKAANTFFVSKLIA